MKQLPRDAVEEGGGATVTSVSRVHSFDVGVLASLEQFHQHRLDALRLVDEGLGADFQTANVRIS